jgi:hypothetical protein
MKKLIIVFLLWLPGVVMAAGPDTVARMEIDHLLEYVKSSNCEFCRNGSCYKADRAVAHLNQKYEYLLFWGAVKTAEDFIERAATESSMSGQPYLIKCNGHVQKSKSWFMKELSRYRRSHESSKMP